jgi:hypothetical protein
MLGRYRQQSVFVLLVLLVALFACSCFGGGGGGGAATTVTPPTYTSLPSSGSVGEVSDLVGKQLLTPEGQVVADEVLRTTQATPAEVVDALTQGKAIVMLFYVAGGADDDSVRKSLDRLKTSFGEYVFAEYDYKVPDAYGDLSIILGVGYSPELVLVDRTGVIKQVWNGYVDEGSLNQSLVNLGRM